MALAGLLCLVLTLSHGVAVAANKGPLEEPGAYLMKRKGELCKSHWK